jgi:hypothetical protein
MLDGPRVTALWWTVDGLICSGKNPGVMSLRYETPFCVLCSQDTSIILSSQVDNHKYVYAITFSKTYGCYVAFGVMFGNPS